MGLRILEFTTEISNQGVPSNVSGQIWDVSGDIKYEPTWKAIARKCDGAVIIYNAFDKSQCGAVDLYLKGFCNNLDASQILIVANKLGGTEESRPGKPKLSHAFEKAKITAINLAEQFSQFKMHFDTLLSNQCIY